MMPHDRGESVIGVATLIAILQNDQKRLKLRVEELLLTTARKLKDLSCLKHFYLSPKISIRINFPVRMLTQPLLLLVRTFEFVIEMLMNPGCR